MQHVGHAGSPNLVLAAGVLVLLLAAIGFVTVVAMLVRRGPRAAGLGCVTASLVGASLFVLLLAATAGLIIGFRRAAVQSEVRARRMAMEAQERAAVQAQRGATEQRAKPDQETRGRDGADGAASPSGPSEAGSAGEVERSGSSSASATEKTARGVLERSNGEEGKGSPEPQKGSAEEAADNSLDIAPEGSAGDVVIPPGRPEWVESAPVREGKTHRTAVSSGLQPRREECRTELEKQLKAATDDYINWYLGRRNAAAWLDYRLPYIESRLLRPENVYDETIQVSFGPMYQSHALLEFDESFRRELDERWRRARAGARLAQTGLGAALILALVATFFGYFRLDTATRGFYTRRLQLAASAAILAWVVIAVLAAKSIPWI